MIENKVPEKMYVVVRGDLKPGLRAAQAAHAVADVVRLYPDAVDRWQATWEDGYLIILEAANEKELTHLFHTMAREQMPVALFLEPDLNFAGTAFACIPSVDQHLWFSHLPLAYSRKARRRKWKVRFRGF